MQMQIQQLEGAIRGQQRLVVASQDVLNHELIRLAETAAAHLSDVD